MATAEQREHEAVLRLEVIYRRREPQDYDESVTNAMDAGAAALARVAALEAAIAEALPWLERGRTHGYAAGWNEADRPAPPRPV